VEVALAKPLSVTEQQHLLGSILEECDRLGRLTDQLLALSREDAAAVRPPCEPTELNALVGAVVEIMRPLAEVKGLGLEVKADRPVQVHGDPARLRQVFFNLLDNAIKYTPEGGNVAVRVEQRDSRAVATVRDTGIGIPAADLPYIFDRFYRVDKARSRAAGGTGLGLSIAQSIVKSHGGEIELTSIPGKGATCTVILPAQPRPRTGQESVPDLQEDKR
jgi:signal transduction histidine kinase